FEQAEDYVNFETTIKETEATAIVVIDDLFAVRIIQLATMFGYKVPADLSVISFNNSIFAPLTHPYLTSIDINVLSLGKIATESLMAQLNHEGSNAVQLVVPHKLIKRETVLNLNNLA
ncbi:substrate-binding domain-containing protein, partial [Enterococcus faecalis]|uniref:substrate-binding domain-containing protein n=1 Tax=Enterococcus faecalis TaxID=1351 RepID=UPI001AD64190